MSISKNLVAIFGGAVSGSEAAHQLAERGIASVVFDQNTLPYGKIEDGLPKWHYKLRDKEEGRINEKLSHPLVTFVPNTKLGEDLQFEDITKWGFSAILLAIGAWKDRPLPIDGIDHYLNRGLIYQNPFVYWFNHKHEPSYAGPTFEIEDGTAIIGGGLASLDVAKVIMFELVTKALLSLGHDIDLFKLDRSIAKVLDELGYTLEDLGLEGCTIYYRRRIKDMPLSPGDPKTPEEIAKAQAVHEKILNNYQSKYLFNIEPLHVPFDKIVEGDRLVGLQMNRTEVVDGRVKTIAGSTREIRFPQVISSIGSIPDLIPGIPTHGQTFKIDDDACCRISGYQNVFALGNTVTGRGNIKESMEHGRLIAQNVIEGYLSNCNGIPKTPAQMQVNELLDKIENDIKTSLVPEDVLSSISKQVKALQEKAGYRGDYMAWADKHAPERLENMLGSSH